MSTSAATPFRSFVQTPIFSVSPLVSSKYRINIIIIIRVGFWCLGFAWPNRVLGPRGVWP